MGGTGSVAFASCFAARVANSLRRARSALSSQSICSFDEPDLEGVSTRRIACTCAASPLRIGAAPSPPPPLPAPRPPLGLPACVPHPPSLPLAGAGAGSPHPPFAFAVAGFAFPAPVASAVSPPHPPVLSTSSLGRRGMSPTTTPSPSGWSRIPQPSTPSVTAADEPQPPAATDRTCPPIGDWGGLLPCSPLPLPPPRPPPPASPQPPAATEVAAPRRAPRPVAVPAATAVALDPCAGAFLGTFWCGGDGESD